jgi:hypothetical protein
LNGAPDSSWRTARILRALGIENLDPDTSANSGKEAAY